MPAIDLARLKKQTANLADIFGEPSAFLRELREVLEFYVNRSLRSQSVAPSSVLPTYRTPVAVLRQIEKELGPVAEQQPILALELADALWDEGWLETKLLAAFLLGRIPPQEERLLARLTAWTQAVRDPEVRAALLTTSCDSGSWLLGRPASESGRLCHGAGGDRHRRVVKLPTLSPTTTATRCSARTAPRVSSA